MTSRLLFALALTGLLLVGAVASEPLAQSFPPDLTLMPLAPVPVVVMVPPVAIVIDANGIRVTAVSLPPLTIPLVTVGVPTTNPTVTTSTSVTLPVTLPPTTIPTLPGLP